MTYRPSLDGLRALACFAVVLAHAKVPGMEGGHLGVDIFFVLSGYLITRVLLTSEPTLTQFYLRRARRLYPALLLMLGTVLLVQAALPLPFMGTDAILAALYLTDYWQIPGSWFEHTWSLSAEEHFYLLWPLALIALRKRPDAWKIMLFATLCLLAWKLAWEYTVGWRAVTNRFDTHATGLAAGCTLALWDRQLPTWTGWIGAALLAVVVVGLRSVPLAEVGTLLVIAGGWGPARLAYLGKLSYGWYLWHYPLMGLLASYVDAPWTTRAAVGIFGGLAMAALSYHTVEAWFRRSSAPHVSDQAGLLPGAAVVADEQTGAAAALLVPRKVVVTGG